jgi:hypothetical protein
MSATKDDINNVSAWAEIIGDMLWAVPRELHEDVLQLALSRQQDLKRRADENGGVLCWGPADTKNWLQSPGIQSYGAIMRLKALLIQIFVRNITNNHSAEDAAKLLFSRQRFGTGTAELRDYIDDLASGYETDIGGNVVPVKKRKKGQPKGNPWNKSGLVTTGHH